MSQDKSLSQSHTETILLLGLGLIAFVSWSLWHFKHDAICAMVLKYSYWITLPWAKLALLVGWTDAPPVRLITNIVRASGMLPKMQLIDIFNVLNKSGLYALPLLYVPLKAAYDAHRHPYRKMRNEYGCWSLIETQERKNPCITPVVRFENAWRAAGSSRPSCLARSETPQEWAIRHKLITSSGNEDMLDIRRARELIIEQLGPKLQDVDVSNIPDYYKALAVIFIERIEGRSKKARESAQAKLDRINLSCDPSRARGSDFKLCFDFSTVAAGFDKAMQTTAARRVLSRHSFMKTFLMGLLFEARKDGKIPCSHFIWLKMVDRPLFYALHGVTPSHIARGFVEAAGPVAQFWAEMTASDYGQSLSGMYIDKAIPALEQRLLEAGIITSAQEYQRS